MVTSPAPTGNLQLGHVLAATGLDLRDIVVLRHTYTESGLRSPGDLTPAKILEYTRWQGLTNKLGPDPAPHWIVFMADGGRRSRLLTTYVNHGELVSERTSALRAFDLAPSDLLSALAGRLVVEWSKDAVNWAKPGPMASTFRLIEIADPEVVPFPGFDNVLIDYAELQNVITDSRYAGWHTALGSVQGIYLIADMRTGQLYVGKADGAERILGRWSEYARDGHGRNIALRGLVGLDPVHARHFMFSILRMFGPTVLAAEVYAAESHSKEALLSRVHGLNRN